MNNIKLYNRYGENIYLEEIEENKYVLKGNTDWCRVIFSYNSMNSINAIDPSGGPYMAVGNFSIDNDSKVLNNIRESESGKFILEFKYGSIKDEETSDNR